MTGQAPGRRVWLATLLFPVLSLVLLLALDQAVCQVGRCEDDDVAPLSSAMMGPLLGMVHVFLSLLLVLPSIIKLRRHLGNIGAPLLAALGWALLLAALLHMPGVDTSLAATLLRVGGWLVPPWFLSGMVTCALWSGPGTQECKA